MSSNSNKHAWFNKVQRWLVPPFPMRQTMLLAESHCGPRNENQDNYLIIDPSGQLQYLQDEKIHTAQHPSWPSSWYRLVVADGMGGHQHGREIATKLINALQQQPVFSDVVALRDATYRIHQNLYDTFNEDQTHNPGSTLLWVDVHISGLVMVSHVGDGRLYQTTPDGHWQQLTHDHHSAEFDWRDPHNQSDEPATIKTNTLAQAMGYGSYGLVTDHNGYRPLRFSKQIRLDLANDLPANKAHHADVFSFYLHAGNSLLLASDGLWSAKNQLDLDFPLAADLKDRTAFSKAIWDYLINTQDNTTAVLLTPNKK